jgi:hypothetical protein
VARLSIVITDEDQARLHRYIPWGLQSRIMRVLVMRMIDLVEKHGDIVLGAFLSGQLSVLDLLRKENTSGAIGPQVDTGEPQ